jgi:hypothetical protein
MFENVEEVHHASDGFYLHPMYASDQKQCLSVAFALMAQVRAHVS